MQHDDSFQNREGILPGARAAAEKTENFVKYPGYETLFRTIRSSIWSENRPPEPVIHLPSTQTRLFKTIFKI